jgi:hypothetical protein
VILPRLVRIENTEAVGIVDVVVFELFEICTTEVVDHEVMTWRHEVWSDGIVSARYLGLLADGGHKGIIPVGLTEHVLVADRPKGTH